MWIRLLRILSKRRKTQIEAIRIQLKDCSDALSSQIGKVRSDFEAINERNKALSLELNEKTEREISELKDRVDHFENWIVFRMYNRIRRIFRKNK